MRKKDGVYQRTKEPPTHITATFKVPLRLAEAINDSITKIIPEKIRFEISAMPDDWWHIYYLGLSDPKYLGRLVFQHFAKAVYEEKLSKLDHAQPRGWQAQFGCNPYKNNSRELWMHEARTFVAAAYTVITYWIKRPKEYWPDHFQVLIKRIEAKGIDIRTHKTMEYSVMEIVVEIFVEKYYDELEEYGPYTLVADDAESEADDDYIDFSDSSNYDSDSIRKIYLKEDRLVAARLLFRAENHNLSIEELAEKML